MAKEKKWGKKYLEICAIKGGGGGPTQMPLKISIFSLRNLSFSDEGNQ